MKTSIEGVINVDFRLLPTINDSVMLGEFIEFLDLAVNSKQRKEQYVCFDFCGAYPTYFDSYRGNFEQLALGWSSIDAVKRKRKTAKELLGDAKLALKTTHCGWKGGEFEMNENSVVYVDNAGEATETAIVGGIICARGVDHIDSQEWVVLKTSVTNYFKND